MTVAQPLIELDASYARAVPRLSVAWTAAAAPAPELLVLNAELAGELGLDAAKLFARAQEPEIKNKLMTSTQSAVERGAFGSPTFFVGDEMFFGKEQLREVEELVTGK